MQSVFAIVVYASEYGIPSTPTSVAMKTYIYSKIHPWVMALMAFSYMLHFMLFLYIPLWYGVFTIQWWLPLRSQNGQRGQVRRYMICFITHVRQLPSARYHEKYHLPDFAYVIIQLPPERRGYSPPFSLCSSLTRIFLTLTAFLGKGSWLSAKQLARYMDDTNVLSCPGPISCHQELVRGQLATSI